MAEVLMNARLQEMGIGWAKAASAGACIWPGDKASSETVEEMKRLGFDLAGRPAVQATPGMLTQADLVLAMTKGVAAYLEQWMPEGTKTKLMTLGEFIGTGEDVDDPYGCGEEVYHAVALQLSRMVNAAAEKLLEENAG